MSAVAKKRKTQRTEPGNSPLILIVLGVGILIVGLLAVSTSMNTATGRVGSAPDFTATTLTGETVRLSDYRGQIVMLNFWATWCPPCRAEMPAIERAYERFSEQGVMVLAINNGETSAEIAPFATTLGLRFPVVLDTDRRLQTAFGMTGYPTSLFIGRDGEIYATHTGGLSSSQLTNYLETGLAQPSA
ncbi:MAG: redoxin domain-containing protein [Anaerolineae bacterium]|nr:redoxin domain-containing protein [Anaerolineae bacterium]